MTQMGRLPSLEGPFTGFRFLKDRNLSGLIPKLGLKGAPIFVESVRKGFLFYSWKSE